jgi:hypothetical protein
MTMSTKFKQWNLNNEIQWNLIGRAPKDAGPAGDVLFLDSYVDILSCGDVREDKRWSDLNSLGLVILVGDDVNQRSGIHNGMIIDSGSGGMMIDSGSGGIGDSCASESHLSGAGISEDSIGWMLNPVLSGDPSHRFFLAVKKAYDKGEDVLLAPMWAMT